MSDVTPKPPRIAALCIGVALVLFAMFWMHVADTSTNRFVAGGLLLVGAGLVGYEAGLGGAAPLQIALLAPPIVCLVLTEMVIDMFPPEYREISPGRSRNVSTEEATFIFLSIVPFCLFIGVVAMAKHAVRHSWSLLRRFWTFLLYVPVMAVFLALQQILHGLLRSGH